MLKSDKFVALVGCGYWGENLVRNFYDLGALRTICDIRQERLEFFKQKYLNIETTNSFKEVLLSSNIKAVAISSPAVTHYELVKKALLYGKDVFVEKPLALNIGEAGELVRLAQKQKRILMVGHILQYHPAISKLKGIIDSNKLGKIQYIYSSRLNIGKLRTEENILWSFAPHDISVVLMLLGEEPVKVNAFGGSYITEGVHDITVTTLEFRNGIRSHIFVSWLHPYKEQKLIVIGSKTMVVFDDLTEEKLFVYPHKIEWVQGKIPFAKKAECKPVKVEKKEPLREELEHFIECVMHRKIPRTDGYEALRVLKVLKLAEKSLMKK